MNNPIIQEVRDAREALAASFGYDLHQIIQNAMEREKTKRTENRQRPNKSLLPTVSNNSLLPTGTSPTTANPKLPCHPAAD
ncbi:MAG: hypothetical protein NTW21_19560 [Verrucomicrobia bacterium]|nr:hypothetical protein [Verrucomicrobiota bacterium]